MSEGKKKEGLTRRGFLRNTSLAAIASFFLGSKTEKAVSRNHNSCEFYNTHHENDKYITEYLGGELLCTQENCKHVGAKRGRIEGDGPIFYYCNIGDALRGQ